MRKPRLLMTASTFPRREGDTEPRFILDLARAMREDFDITVLAPAAPGARESEDLEGVHVERYHYFPIHRWETLCYPGAIVPRIREKKVRVLLVPFLFLGLWRAIQRRRHDYDLVHAHWLIPQGVVQSFFEIPYALTGHGGDVASLNVGSIKALKKRAVRRAFAVTAVSADLRDIILSWFDGEEREQIAKKIQILPMGCDTERFRPKTGRDIPTDRPIVLFVGRLAEKKGVRYLIEAMQSVDARLWIVGDGPLRGELEQQTAALNLTDKITFLGSKSHDDLPEIYASVDVFAAPSVTAGDGDKEGFGLVILEAMASGLPVVASHSGGILDIITDGVNGLLAPERDSKALAQAITRLLEDSDFRDEILTHAQDTVSKYDYHTIGRRYANLLNE